MDDLRALVEQQHFFTRVDALEAGYADRDLTAAVRARRIVRFRRGYYAHADQWAALDDVGRHVVRARAVSHSLGPTVTLSHTSAALVHGLTTWGADLDRVHVTRLDSTTGRIEGDVVHHENTIGGGDLVQVGGLSVVSAHRAAVETGTLLTAEQALVTLDSALFLGLTSHGTMARFFESVGDWPHTRHLQLPMRMADPGAQSAGESRGRWLFFRHGLPAPLTQYDVHGSDGRFIGTCDWAWPDHGLLGEFDGRVKYGRLLRPGQEPGDVVFGEKQREDRLREATSYRMIRLVWADLDRPRTTVDRLRRALRSAA